MKFTDILEEELDIADKDLRFELFPLISRAAERYKNQQTSDLQARILSFRQCLLGDQRDAYDEWFGISAVRESSE